MLAAEEAPPRWLADQGAWAGKEQPGAGRHGTCGQGEGLRHTGRKAQQNKRHENKERMQFALVKKSKELEGRVGGTTPRRFHIEAGHFPY